MAPSGDNFVRCDDGSNRYNLVMFFVYSNLVHDGIFLDMSLLSVLVHLFLCRGIFILQRALGDMFSVPRV